MVSDFNYWSRVGKRLFSLAITTLILYLVLKLSIFYLPFLIAFALALLIEPIIKFLMKKLKWTRKLSSVFVIIISIVLIVVKETYTPITDKGVFRAIFERVN